MSGTMTELGVAGRLALRAIGRRLRGEVEASPDLERFVEGMNALLAAAPDGVVRSFTWTSLPAQRPPWLESGMDVDEGDEVSTFAEGRVYANAFLDIYVGPELQLWCRLGEDGEVFRGTRASHSFVAQRTGQLLFGNYFPNDWADRHGARVQSDDVYQSVSGELRVLAIRWACPAVDGLKVLKEAGDFQGRVAGELARLAAGDRTPPGWQYLWHLGPAEIYEARKGDGGVDCMHCATHADVGILQKDVDLPLDADVEISWRWRVDELPSTLREDAVPSHDYLSLAVEFDDGKDITYYWSRSLPVGRGYWCPLPNWKDREFHVVVRSGAAGLGGWQAERRHILADYRRYMGEPPSRIVRIWLIACSVFQRGRGACDYADILLHGGSGTTRLL